MGEQETWFDVVVVSHAVDLYRHARHTSLQDVRFPIRAGPCPEALRTCRNDARSRTRGGPDPPVAYARQAALTGRAPGSRCTGGGARASVVVELVVTVHLVTASGAFTVLATDLGGGSSDAFRTASRHRLLQWQEA
ncbi:hypothetical protein GCM10023195_24420 [Actinoallomurus liliacearum]|uniref:Uncharacterized protein n=1 Tax=Actinoallomurus liliacearum TaxID=1080073 RepID=A0ABP8TIU1_9ACTN